MRSLFKFLRRLAFGLGGVLLVIALALVIGAIPFGSSKSINSVDEDRMRIYVLSNGFHSDIVLPKQFTEQYLPITEEDYPVDASAMRHYAVGWGSKKAFTSLLDIVDFTPSIIAQALAFDETVIHVTPLGDLQLQQGVYALDITEEQAIKLVRDINNWFEDGEPLTSLSQGFGDRFYASRGHFSPWATCNTWTGRRLRNAGIAIGLWTPAAQSLEFGLARLESNP